MDGNKQNDMSPSHDLKKMCAEKNLFSHKMCIKFYEP